MLVPSTDWSPMIKNLEIKGLCSLILKKTINDEDKYQAGLTKIFFRAGMLAALESLRSEKLNGLVTLIQKNVRRRLAVRNYQNMRKAAIKIQTWWRGILSRRLVANIRREVNARKLQCIIRRYVQRSRFLVIRSAIISVQSRMLPLLLYFFPSDLWLTPLPRNTRGCLKAKVQRAKVFSCCNYSSEFA